MKWVLIRMVKFLICAVAMELYSKLGAEGETAHSENGISRTYENGFVSSSLLKSVVPYVGSVGVKNA